MFINIFIRYTFLVILFCLTPVIVTANDGAEDNNSPTEEPQVYEVEENLQLLDELIKSNQAKLNSLSKQISNLNEGIEQTELIEDKTSLETIINEQKQEFNRLATGGIRVNVSVPRWDENYNWRDDAEAIMQPLLSQIKELTADPRALEQLKTERSFWNQRSSELDLAETNLAVNLDKVKSSKLNKQLVELQALTSSRREFAQQQMQLIDAKIANLSQHKASLSDTTIGAVKSFFTSMGLHFFLAVFIGLGLFYLILLMAKAIAHMVAKREIKHIIFVERMIQLVARIVGAVIGVLAYLMILYGFSEWLLIILSLAVFAAIGLSVKDTFPEYVVEIRTMLNLGSIRQDERVVYEGIAWKVRLIDIYTHLHNPLLDGHIRIPLTHAATLSSRPYHKSEPWFPCKTGQFIRLDDGVFGKVILQSPEQVQVALGGMIHTYPTSDFLSKRPSNLSEDGFSVYITFGVSYDLQAKLIDDVLPTLTSWLKQQMAISEYHEHHHFIKVEIDKAATSSLDFKIIAAFDGAVADKYFQVQRYIQKLCIQACTQEGWEIPFQQITVHQASTSEE